MKRRQSGLAMIEFVLIATSLFFLVFVIVEFGHWLHTWNALAEATRRGARLAAVTCPASAATAVKNAVRFENGALVAAGLTANNVCIQYTYNGGACPANAPFPPLPPTDVSVSIINYNYSFQLLGLNVSATPATIFETTIPLESAGTQAGSGCTPTCVSYCP